MNRELRFVFPIAAIALATGIVVPAQAQRDKPQDDLIDRWFSVFTKELNDLSKTKGRWVTSVDKDGKIRTTWIQPRFGGSRLATIAEHDLPMDAEYIGDQNKIQEELSRRGLLGLLWIYGSGTGALDPKTMSAKMTIDSAAFPDGTHSLDQWQKPKGAEVAVKAIAADALKAKDSAKPLVRDLFGWEMETRIFRITNPACLKCHTRSKLNDPVAVFVFATKPGRVQ